MANTQDTMASMFNKLLHLPQFSSFPVAEYKSILTHMITDLSHANTQAMNGFMKSNSNHMQELTHTPNKAMNILSDWSCENTEQFHQHSMSILDILFKSVIECQHLISGQIHQSEHKSEFDSKGRRKKSMSDH